MSATSTVFLCRVPDRQPAAWPGAVNRLLDRVDLTRFAGKNDRIAIKLHVGEPGLATSLPPEVAGTVARRLRAAGMSPFFTDTSVLYAGRRSTGIGHAEVAFERGFDMERAGAVFVPADGIEGNLEVEVPIDGRRYRKVGIAEAIVAANGVFAVSHATGHLLSGFAATLKNLGMGCASRKGKLLQHSDTKPFVKAVECLACGDCVEHCPSGAMSLNEVAVLDEPTCTGCGECIAQCRSGAIGFHWDSGSAGMQEKMAEHALGVVRAARGKLLCLLGAVNLTQHCDCWGPGSERVVPDVGFLLSTDPVAADQAALDLVREANGRRLDEIAWPQLDGTVQLAYAEELGIGSRSYHMVEV